MSNIYSTAIQVAEESFAKNGTLSPAEMALVHQVVRVNDRHQRLREILVKTLQDLQIEDREAWLVENPVSSNILAMLDEPQIVDPVTSFVSLPGYTSADLAQRKESAKRSIVAEAERQAARVVRGNSRQFSTYTEKRAEAAAHLAGETIDTPHLDAEVGISGDTKDDVANAIMTSAAAWTQANAQVEAARISGQQAVDAAEGVEDIDAAVDAACGVMRQAVDALLSG